MVSPDRTASPDRAAIAELVAGARVFALPLRVRFRGITVREGVLLQGPVGWGEFSPFVEYGDAEALPWLAAAVESALYGWPAPVRRVVSVNAIVPAVDPEHAALMVAASGCRTAKVKVADHPGSLADDVARVAAVRQALGTQGAVRVDANAVWDVETAVAHLRALDEAAGGLQYAEQPCASLAELAEVRRRVRVPIAADESIRRAADPMAVALAGAADVMVLKGTPLGGVRSALAVARAIAGRVATDESDAAVRPRWVVSSALETGVGLASEIALAGALPDLELACGLGTAALFARDVVAEPPSPVDGLLVVPTAPPAPDVDLLRAAAPLDATREHWWRERLARVADLLVTAG